MPETVTPWLLLFVTFMAALAAAGGAWMWIWRKALWPAFQGGVLDAVEPLRESLESLTETIKKSESVVQGKLDERSSVVDRKFEELSNRLQLLELRQSRDTQKVVEAVQTVQETVSPPREGA